MPHLLLTNNTFHSDPIILFSLPYRKLQTGSYTTHQAPSSEASLRGASLGFLDGDTRGRYLLRTSYPLVFLRLLQEQPGPTMFSIKKMPMASILFTRIPWSSSSSMVTRISTDTISNFGPFVFVTLGLFLKMCPCLREMYNLILDFILKKLYHG